MSVACFGELLIDFVANETGVTVGEASGFLKKPGGAPANVAVAVRRLGHTSAMLTQVGDDPFGHYLAGVLDAENVNTHGIRFSAEARTSLAFVSLRADGERSFTFYRHPGADMLMRPETLALDVIDAHEVFHFGSISLISEPSRSATLSAADYARSRGRLISYDPNLRLALWPDAEAARAGMLTGLDYANIVKISAEELEFLTGGNDPAPLWRDTTKALIVTQGADGATLYTSSTDSGRHVPGFRVAAVDTTGAGDGFVGGLLVSLLECGGDYNAVENVRFANAVGALTSTQYGAIPALPTREQVEAFLRQLA